ncbi:MAG: very short patch repair endonuclease [Methanothrix sp.]
MEFNTTPKISYKMSRIRSKETGPEIILRRTLWSIGVRGYRKYPDLPGKPDLIFKKAKLIIFVDGCFWHGCPIHFKRPKKNIKYWDKKIDGNKKRSKEIDKLLKDLGYHVLRIWEHDIRSNPMSAALMVREYLKKSETEYNSINSGLPAWPRA